MSNENILNKLTEITGFRQKELDSIVAEVKANSKALLECPSPHDFSICLDRRTKQRIDNPSPGQRFNAKWQCSKCGGRIDNMEKVWYERGLEHARL